MATAATNPSPTPFHAGELEVQARYGVLARMQQLGTRVIRDHMPDQHRDFFQQLPHLFVGSVDEHGQPWASVLVGSPGFIESPDANTLHVRATPLAGDPLEDSLSDGAPIGLLGIAFDARRRNRINSVVSERTPDQIRIQVSQSFGNCPKYIQVRELDLDPRTDREPGEVVVADALNTQDRALITAADTFFIASSSPVLNGSAQNGADISHRGGKPGFVHVATEQQLTIPDYTGNNHFNTLGNLIANPKAGLLFPDFDRGDLLQLAGTTEVEFSGPDVSRFPGAQRLIHFEIKAVRRLVRALPFNWHFREYSKFLP